MPQPRSQNRSLAFELWKSSSGKRALIDIASELAVSPELVRKWKSQDKWQLQAEQTSRKRGGQKGNSNSVGNRGGPPNNNINAVVTGEFESVIFDTLAPEEFMLISKIHTDKIKIVQEELILLTIRERRMMQRIAEASSIQDLDLIYRIEEALTRVQARKQILADQLHRIDNDSHRYDLDLKRLEIELIKVENTNSQSNEPVDDNFLAALESRAIEVWTDESDDT